jgi:hypothetical protein
MDLLCKHYGFGVIDPERWKKLSFLLAKDVVKVPGLQLKTRSPGAPKQWQLSLRLKLINEIEALTRKGCTVEAATETIAKEQGKTFPIRKAVSIRTHAEALRNVYYKSTKQLKATPRLFSILRSSAERENLARFLDQELALLLDKKSGKPRVEILNRVFFHNLLAH